MSKRLTTEEFISRAEKMYGDRYVYEKIKYESAHKKVSIGCKIHGDFEATPANFLSGKGCKKCGREAAARAVSLDTSSFIAKAKLKHGDRYDYSEVIYLGMTTSVSILCREHGPFEQTPQNHLQNGGCKSCGLDNRAATRTLQPEQVLDRFKAIHGDKYDYSKMVYQGIFAKIDILCPEHGVFQQTPDRHMAGCGCPSCASGGPSTPELEILAFVTSIDPEAEGSNRTVIAPQELDIYSEKHKLAIEFHGLYFHSDKFRSPKYHSEKLQKCREVGVDLIQVFEDEWADPVKRGIVKSIIASRMGEYKNRIAARKTVRKPITAAEARRFLSDNHLQGFAAADKYEGLEYEGEMVCVMLLTPPRSALTKAKNEYDLELVRFATKLGWQVQGGFTKLLHPHKDKRIVTYCDKRVFNAKGYEACGFRRIRENAPEYYYVRGAKRYSRHGFQRKNLPAKLKYFDPALTERENMARNRYHRIYGCGTTTFALNVA